MGKESLGTTLEVGPEELNAEIAELNALIENKNEEWEHQAKENRKFRLGEFSSPKDANNTRLKMEEIGNELNALQKTLKEKKQALKELTLRPK